MLRSLKRVPRVCRRARKREFSRTRILFLVHVLSPTDFGSNLDVSSILFGCSDAAKLREKQKVCMHSKFVFEGVTEPWSIFY